MRQIFIAYATKDLKLMQDLRDRLTAAGFRPWIDPNPRPGADWRPEIDAAIVQADAMLVLMTPNAAQSVYVTYEWTWALAHDIPVITLILRESSPHPRLLQGDVYDTQAWTSVPAYWEHVLRTLHRRWPAAEDAEDEKRRTRLQNYVLPPQHDNRAMPRAAGHWLVMRRGPQPNEMMRLNKAVMTLGRDEANDIVILDAEVSRFHLKLHHAPPAGYSVEDLGSTNGTQLNGRAVDQITALQPGDQLTLGDSVLLSYEVV